jgi:hypothetical protein
MYRKLKIMLAFLYRIGYCEIEIKQSQAHLKPDCSQPIRCRAKNLKHGVKEGTEDTKPDRAI